MNLKQYKTYRSNNFAPLIKTKNATKKQDEHCKISTFGIITTSQPPTYELHSNNASESRDNKKLAIMFNDHQYLERQFTQVFSLPTYISNNFELTHIDSRRKQLLDQKNKSQKNKIFDRVRQSIVQNNSNIFIFPVLDTDNANQLIFPKNYKLDKQIGNVQSVSSQHSQKRPNQNNCILQTVVKELLEKKSSNTIVCLSILSVNNDGSLVDELDLQWISEPNNIDISAKQKAKLKVKKMKKNIKTFQLNRQQINSWSEAHQIISHYQQVSDYVQYWKNYEDTCIQCKNGQIYEISEVLVDPQYGSILQVSKRAYLLRINQYLPTSNLIMMKISHLLTNLLQKNKPSNVRDYSLTLFLSECFDYEKNYKVNLFTQLGTVQTLKEQCVCLSMNLKVPGEHIYFKNYCDNPKLIKKIKNYAQIFIPEQQNKDLKLAQKVKLGKNSVRLYEQSAKVTTKSFSYQTYSSFNKKRNQENQILQKNLTYNRQDANLSLIDVYGSQWKNSNGKRDNEHRRKSQMSKLNSISQQKEEQKELKK